MSEERKEYEVKGVVTISTDEYRDLLTDKFEAQKDADSYRNRYWSEQSESNKLKEKIEVLEKGQKNYRDFVNSSPEITALYKQWLVSKQDDEI